MTHLSLVSSLVSSASSDDRREPKTFRSTDRRRHIQAPAPRTRMLRSPSSGVAREARTQLRLDVPERLLRMTRFGLDFASEDSGWWRQVELEMQALVDAHLPSQASDVEMHLDVDRLEVVLDYALPSTPEHPRRYA